MYYTYGTIYIAVDGIQNMQYTLNTILVLMENNMYEINALQLVLIE